jgi:Beta-propeller repeat
MNTLRSILPGLFSFGFLTAAAWAQSPAPSIENYARLPLAFEKQTAASAERFVARGEGYVIGLEKAKALIGVEGKDKSSHTVSLEFTGSQPRRHAIAGSELPGKVNYIRGNDPTKWQIGLATYARITYPDIYPGIDIVYYGNQRQLEFDLVVKPGADPGAIRLKVEGAGRLTLDDSGALALGDGLSVALPQIFQEVNGTKKSVPGHYAVVSRDEVAFRIDPWDRTLPLTIDPTVVYSAMFGGGLNGYNNSNAIGVDSLGNILLAGVTDSVDFPTLDPYQIGFGGNEDAYVTKINPTGTALVYSTYLGGSSYDYAQGLAVDSTNAVWITGVTNSSDFPVLHAAQSALGGASDAFVARLDANGVLQFSTFLGGSAGDFGNGIAVDGKNNGYVAGLTYGTLPTTPGALQSGTAFVAKYGPTGTLIFSALPVYGTIQAIAVDSAGEAFITGSTNDGPFTGMPPGGAQATNNGGTDAFVSKLSANGASLIYFTFFGGTGLDQGTGIAVDGMGNAYIAGQTNSTGLATAGAAQAALAGGIDGFIAKLNPAGSQFTYVTYLGGIRQDILTGLALGDAGSVYLTGYTDSNDFPAVLPLQSPLPGAGTSLSRSVDSASSFSASDLNIPGAVAALSINPSTGSTVVATEVGIYRTTNGGTSWTQQFAGSFSGTTAFIARSPVSPSTLYLTQYYNSFYRSTDDGVTWTSLSPSPSEAGGILADPLTAATVYLFCNCSPAVYKSTDGGTTWNGAITGLPVAQVGAMTATSDGAIYAGVSGFGIYKSTNQGGSWTAVNTGLPVGVYVYPYALTASGTTVYFVALGFIYESTNGGTNWAATPTSVGASYVAPSPTNPAIFYAFTSSGAIQGTTDGGTTWSVPATGLPPGISYYPSQLVVDPGNSTHVFLATAVNQAAFVAKLNSGGSAFTWSTYLGGNAFTYATAVASNGAGYAFVTGYTTNGSGFPVTSSALPAGNYAAFVTKISDATAACSTLSVSPGSSVISEYGQTIDYSVVAPSGCAWTASVDQSWAVIQSAKSGTGDGFVIVQVSTSNSTTQTATLTVGSQHATITRPGYSCNYSTDMSSYPVPSGGGPVSIILTATAGCPWSVRNSDGGAVSITSGASGTGSATIDLMVSPNTTVNQRTFNLGLGNYGFMIVQAGGLIAQTITFNAPPNQALGTTPPPLSATANSGLAVTFTSNTTAACTVSGVNGVNLTLVAVGTCSISANQAGNSTYAAATQVTQTFTIYSLTPQTINFGALANQILGTTVPPLSATATSGLTVGFGSNTTAVCTVSGVNITLVTTGTCSITASQPGNTTYAAAPSITQTFSIFKSQTITFGTPSNQTMRSAPVALSATATSGLAVAFASNSMPVCTVSGVGVTLVMAGTCSITASQSGNSTYAAAAPVTRTFLVSGGPPAIVSLSPTSGAGTSVTFKAVYADLDGAGDLSELLLQVNSTQSSANACYVYYQPQGNHLYLANNAGSFSTPVLTPGVAGTASNSQCALNAALSSVTMAGNDLTLNAALTFNSGFVSSRNVYLYAAGLSGLNTGWIKAGQWTPNPVAQPPAIVSLSPGTGTGTSVKFEAVYSDPNGAGDLNEILLQVNSSQSSANACYVYYQPQGNHLYLANNAGNTWMTPALTPGVAGTASNSQCTLNAASSSVVTAGNNLTLNAAVTFSGTVLGLQNVYLYGAGFSGLNSGWVRKGSWTPNPVAGPPVIVSLAPNSGTGETVTFQAVYSDPNGAADLSELLLQINATQSGGNACYVYYQPQGNHLYLANNAGAWITPALTPGVAGTASNSQCTLNAGSSSVAMMGNNLTLNVAVTFSGTFVGSKNVYLYAAGLSALNSGWVKKGTWAP